MIDDESGDCVQPLLPAHVTFELAELHCAHPVELVLWGPYATSIGDLVGEIVGVVRHSDFAVGVQALNTKTLGGYPSTESDTEPDGMIADDPGNNLPEALNQQQLWRGDTAKHTNFGSTLQACCRNRTEPRLITNWGNENFTALPWRDGGVVGSKIALFACPAERALSTIGEIEVAEGVPHPPLDGTWAKMQPHATASYLSVDFGEDTIDQAIRMTQKAGLRYLYQSSPFSTSGHFKLKPELFPNGWDGFRSCVLRHPMPALVSDFTHCRISLLPTMLMSHPYRARALPAPAPASSDRGSMRYKRRSRSPMQSDFETRLP